MVRKDLLNYLLLLGSKRNFFSEYPIVSASTKGSNNLLLAHRQGIANIVEHEHRPRSGTRKIAGEYQNSRDAV